MYGIYVGFEEKDALGKKLHKSFVRRDRLEAETLLDNIVAECKSKMVDATVDLIDLNEDALLRREKIDESAAREAWLDFFPPLWGVKTY